MLIVPRSKDVVYKDWKALTLQNVLDLVFQNGVHQLCSVLFRYVLNKAKKCIKDT